MFDALAKGHVIKTQHRGIDFFYFPEVTVGKHEEIEDEQQILRSKDIDTESHDTIKDLMEKSNWVVKSSTTALEV